MVVEVQDSVQKVCELMFARPGMAGYSIPKEFWETQIGNLVLRAYFWANGDELNLTDRHKDRGDFGETFIGCDLSTHCSWQAFETTGDLPELGKE
jgi:hypothetical protein